MNKNIYPSFFYRFLKSLFLLFFLFNISCEENTNSAPDEQGDKANFSQRIDEDYYQFSNFNLNKHDIEGSIMLPNETSRIGTSEVPKVKHSPGGFKWKINVGSAFNLYIEDFGDKKDLVLNHKMKLEAQKNVYTVKYIEALPNLLIYKKTLKESSLHSSYHIYAQKKVNGISYEIKNKYQGDKKDVVMFMKKSIASFKSSS